MSVEGQIRANIANLKAIRESHLSNAVDQRAKARGYRAQRDNPSQPTRAYEHRQECDRKADAAERDADTSTRLAEGVLNEIRGLESRLR